ncbi:helix-turn-helix transcriptional regulator [Mycolicibacterium sphagni]|uniref:helix-turn-helix transcriptional regulator n=1 Tax=Mycolicibacterium sphagni TaxID=1786 RepID=UPI0021F36E0A|nr:helix-turn-helix domain-containing protein [Mycolicibacterium sphagni]MCV7176138.1 helix-turn-helix domain-containing protein [Mycolicibacterium sphagni]
MGDFAKSLYDLVYQAVRDGVRDALRESAPPAPPVAGTRDLLTAAELEERTGISASTWRYWAHIGQDPPSVKIGRRRLWKWSEVHAWIERRKP